jgi:hypothetical protein
VGRPSKEVGRAKHELVRSYWLILVFICIFPLWNAYSVCMYTITQFALVLLNNAVKKLWQKLVYKTQSTLTDSSFVNG